MPAKSILYGCLLASLGTAVTSTPILTRDLTSESQKLADPNYGPIPGQDPIYNSYYGVKPPFPGYLRDAVLPTEQGPPGADDHVWQNLLSAECKLSMNQLAPYLPTRNSTGVIFDFYQQAVEQFNSSVFTQAGLPNTTYRRVQEIRNNEAGHLRLFQNQISAGSVKPGACAHRFPYYDAASFLALVTVLEVSSMAFLTGLVQQVRLPGAAGAMAAVAETEARHEVWSLIAVWGADPFAGPSDTVFHYANQILDTTRPFVVPGSCPAANPEYPTPRQDLPALGAAAGTASLLPGARIGLNFTDPENQPRFAPGRQYHAVFFHGVANVSVPIDVSRWCPGGAGAGNESTISVTIPEQFETKGVIIAVVADAPGAPTAESVVAGPGIILEQPAWLATELI